MKTKQLFLVLVAFIFVAVSGCGKYDDGPGISLATKKGRLVNKWKIEKYFMNDVEQTIGDTVAVMELKKDNSCTMSWTGSGLAILGTWAFDGNKENVLITWTDIFTGLPYTETHKILRLKSNELWESYTESVLGVTTECKTYWVTE